VVEEGAGTGATTVDEAWTGAAEEDAETALAETL